MACLLYNTGKCLQLLLFNRPIFGVHFSTRPLPGAGIWGFLFKKHENQQTRALSPTRIHASYILHPLGSAAWLVQESSSVNPGRIFEYHPTSSIKHHTSYIAHIHCREADL